MCLQVVGRTGEDEGVIAMAEVVDAAVRDAKLQIDIGLGLGLGGSA